MNLQRSLPPPAQRMEAPSQADVPKSQKEPEHGMRVSQEEAPGLAQGLLPRFVLCYCYQLPSKPSHRVAQLWTINSKALFWIRVRASPAQTTFPSIKRLLCPQLSPMALPSMFLYLHKGQARFHFSSSKLHDFRCTLIYSLVRAQTALHSN